MNKSVFHNRIGPALLDPTTWLAIAGALGGLATQIPAPFAYAPAVLACLALIAGAVLKGGGGQ